MAEAKEMNKKVPRQIIVHDDVTVVNLELSVEEAKFLRAVMNKISGSSQGLRGIADGIGTALQAVVGSQYFTADCWFDNDYYRDGKRCGLSFGKETSVENHISTDLNSW
jgi:hypothetical protein